MIKFEPERTKHAHGTNEKRNVNDKNVTLSIQVAVIHGYF